MRLKSLPSRILLCLLLCLNGSTGLWASTLMALAPDHAHTSNRARDGSVDCAASSTAHAGDHCRPADLSDSRDGDGADQRVTASSDTALADVADTAGADDRRDHHQGGFEDCWCPSPAAGCSCNCVVPTIASSHGVPFAAHHLMTTAAPADPDLPDLPYQTGNIFRPPIG
mgnify:CR=1 FL=1